MGLYLGGLIIRRIFASEIWGGLFVGGFIFGWRGRNPGVIGGGKSTRGGRREVGRWDIQGAEAGKNEFCHTAQYSAIGKVHRGGNH